MSDQPYDFGTASEKLNAVKAAQQASEDALSEAYKAAGAAEKAYRLALAKMLVELRANGKPATLCLDLAKGDPRIADLRFKRDVALGVREAAKQAVYRHSANRRDLEELVDWSKRRDLAEGYGTGPQPQWSTPRAA